VRDQQAEYFGWWDQAIEPFAGDARRQIEALFEAYLDLARFKAKADCGCKTSRGCALGNAAVEIPEGNEMLGGIVHGYKTEIRKRLRKLAREAGARDPEVLGDALMLLMEGGYYTRLTFPQNTGPVAAIAKAARALVEVSLDQLGGRGSLAPAGKLQRLHRREASLRCGSCIGRRGGL